MSGSLENEHKEVSNRSKIYDVYLSINADTGVDIIKIVLIKCSSYMTVCTHTGDCIDKYINVAHSEKVLHERATVCIEIVK